METTPVRTAVLLDRHPLWMEATELVLERSSVAVVAKTTSWEAALKYCADLRPDLLLLDPGEVLPASTEAAFAGSARSSAPDLRIIAFAASREAADVTAAFESGMSAYVLKSAHADDLATAVRQLFDQSVYLATPRMRDRAASATAAAGARGETALTRRESEILALAAEGCGNREIARRLWVAEQTVKFHLSNIYRKLEVSNRTEASCWAHRNGITSSGARRGGVPSPA